MDTLRQQIIEETARDFAIKLTELKAHIQRLEETGASDRQEARIAIDRLKERLAKALDDNDSLAQEQLNALGRISGLAMANLELRATNEAVAGILDKYARAIEIAMPTLGNGTLVAVKAILKGLEVENPEVSALRHELAAVQALNAELARQYAQTRQRVEWLSLDGNEDDTLAEVVEQRIEAMFLDIAAGGWDAPVAELFQAEQVLESAWRGYVNGGNDGN